MSTYTTFHCGSDNCRVIDNKMQQDYRLNNLFTLSDIRTDHGFNVSKAPSRTIPKKVDGTAVNIFDLKTGLGTVPNRDFAWDNRMEVGYRAPKMKQNGTGDMLEVANISLFRTAVYKGNGPKSIEVESSLRYEETRGGSQKSTRTIMSNPKVRDRFEDLFYDPQALRHVEESSAGLPPRGGYDSHVYSHNKEL